MGLNLTATMDRSSLEREFFIYFVLICYQSTYLNPTQPDFRIQVKKISTNIKNRTPKFAANSKTQDQLDEDVKLTYPRCFCRDKKSLISCLHRPNTHDILLSVRKIRNESHPTRDFFLRTTISLNQQSSSPYFPPTTIQIQNSK